MIKKHYHANTNTYVFTLNMLNAENYNIYWINQSDASSHYAVKELCVWCRCLVFNFKGAAYNPCFNWSNWSFNKTTFVR